MTMPIVRRNPWEPLYPNHPLWAVLIAFDPRCASMPGHWEVRQTDSHGDTRVAQNVVRLGHLEFRYIAPGTSSTRTWIRRWWSLLVGVALKFKLLLIFGVVVLNLLVYGLAFGWGFAVGLMAIIAIHEMGHVVANRRKGLPASLPLFIPFLGAFIGLKARPKDAADEAFIGIMGPLFGIGATLVAVALALGTHQAIFWVIADVGFLMHVFNLMPVLPLDGGRSVAFWGFKAWIPGILGMLVVLFYNPFTHRFSFHLVTVVIVALVAFSLLREPKGRPARYTAVAVKHKVIFGGLWGMALAVSIAGYWLVGAR